MVTWKQKNAFKKVVKGSNITNAMKDVGYSKETAKRTNKLTNSKGWQELMDKYLPDETLTSLHKEGLNATLVKTATDKGIITDEKEYSDYPTRHKFLDLAYKLKGKNEPEKHILEITLDKEDVKTSISNLSKVN